MAYANRPFTLRYPPSVGSRRSHGGPACTSISPVPANPVESGTGQMMGRIMCSCESFLRPTAISRVNRYAWKKQRSSFPYASRLRAGALQRAGTDYALPFHQPFKFHWRDEDDARQRSLERLERFRPAIHNFRFLGVACKRKAQRKNLPVSLISDRLLVLNILETHFDEENLAKYFFGSSGL